MLNIEKLIGTFEVVNLGSHGIHPQNYTPSDPIKVTDFTCAKKNKVV